MRGSCWLLAIGLAGAGLGCNGEEGGGGTGGASSAGGATNSGGRGGGGTGSGGGAAESCGSAVCGPTEFCCNRSCSLCAPRGSGCIQVVCADAGIPGSCRAAPTQDSVCASGGYPPHYYACDLTVLPAPCVQVYWGDVLQAFCCE